MKKELDVELLLRWAYRDELPKKGAVETSPGWDAIGLGGPIDDDGFRLPAYLGEPHPDALIVERVVNAIESSVVIDMAESLTMLLPDLGAYASTASWNWGRPHNPKALMIMHARMGTRPDWATEPPRLVRVQGGNGKPVVNGVRPGGRYDIGACCPLRLDPSLDLIVSGRSEYAVWRHFLDVICESLAGWTLREHAVRPAKAAHEPWVTGREPEEPAPRILPSLLAPAAKPAHGVAAARRRVRAGT